MNLPDARVRACPHRLGAAAAAAGGNDQSTVSQGPPQQAHDCLEADEGSRHHWVHRLTEYDWLHCHRTLLNLDECNPPDYSRVTPAFCRGPAAGI